MKLLLTNVEVIGSFNGEEGASSKAWPSQWWQLIDLRSATRLLSQDLIIRQLRSIRPAIRLILAVSALFIGTVLIVHFWKGIRIDQLTRDPSSIMRIRPYIGFLSNIGIFFWSATATVCFLGGKLITNNERLKRFLLASGLLTLFLGLDDLFLFHEA